MNFAALYIVLKFENYNKMGRSSAIGDVTFDLNTIRDVNGQRKKFTLNNSIQGELELELKWEPNEGKKHALKILFDDVIDVKYNASSHILKFFKQNFEYLQIFPFVF